MKLHKTKSGIQIYHDTENRRLEFSVNKTMRLDFITRREDELNHHHALYLGPFIFHHQFVPRESR